MTQPTDSATVPTQNEDTTPRKYGPAKVVLAIVIPLVLSYFIGRSIWTQWELIKSQDWRLDLWWLLGSAVLGWLVFVLLVHLWRVILAAGSGKHLRLFTAYRILAVSNLGKYIPLKIWTVMGMLYFLKREGYSATSGVASVVLHQAFTIISGFIFAGVILGAGLWDRLPLIPVIVGLGISLLILYPPFFARVLNRGLQIIGREPIVLQLSFKKAVGLFALYSLAWVIYGASPWFLLHGVGLDPGNFWEISASFVAAYLIGFLALFAPGGLGVREGILTVLLTPHFGSGIAALVAVVARLWMTILELLQLTPLIKTVRAATSEIPRPPVSGT